ncbi:MAG: hypothetical protein GYB35_16105 [Algicola sp.]|nr:hypothetical protein [Algicola sp.]
MTSNLTYAIHKNELVHISQVTSGLDCNCICPNSNCKGKLVARKGKVKSHHFAHYSLEDCGGAIESSLHLLAKDILRKTKVFALPDLIGYELKSNRTAKVANKLTGKIEKVE